MPRGVDLKERKKATSVDKHVGRRLRVRRTMLGMSQTELANSVSITFQQVQKYERGSNRIGASRLYQFAQVLSVPPGYFFEGLGAERRKGRKNPMEERVWFKRETLELARAYARIGNTPMRELLLKLVRAAADGA
ncbi:MAG TPA: helix-turn-helix transcriptional regulator [Alphaproteobacteria bacterium]